MTFVDLSEINPTVQSATHFIRMVAINSVRSVILLGNPGLGKTYLIRNTLDSMNKPYTFFSGHVTLACVYEFLYENRDKLIVFDDTSNVVSHREIMELLKAALNNNDGYPRVLSYHSKGVLNEGVPPEFEFTGGIIFTFNLMDSSNLNVKAILDRSLVVKLDYSREDLLKAMYKVAGTDVEKIMITKVIENVTNIGMDLSLRKQDLSFKLYKSFQILYGDNQIWITQVQKLFSKRRQHWLQELVIELCGENGRIKRTDLVREMAKIKEMSIRTAQRKIREAIELEIIYQNKLKKGDISVLPFK